MTRRNAHILFVDDDLDVLFSGALLLRENGYRVSTLNDPEFLPGELKKELPDLVLLDMNFRSEVYSGNEGLYWMRQLLKKWELPVIMITPYGEIELAVQAIKEGAADFLTKPWQNEKLLETVSRNIRRTVRNRNGQKETERSVNDPLIGQSEALLRLKETVHKIAATDASVMLTGENGTGKEVVARTIHQNSKRADKPFVAVDLGAIPESLFESEMFGHKKGAFTDAREDHTGKFEQAHGGTLFLDELGNLPLPQQAKMLVAIQSRQIRPLGATQSVDLDIRIISATNSDLHRMVEEKSFRQDLLYRLNTVRIHLEPLRNRGVDIRVLAEHFLSQYCQKYEKEELALSTQAMKALESYSWPGNVRELQHVLERAVILSEGPEIVPADLSLDAPSDRQTPESEEGTTLESMEKQAIQKALEHHQGNISLVAQELGLSRAALYRRLSKYNL